MFIDGSQTEADVADYMNYGPNNELYLAPGQAIAFDLNVPSTDTAKVATIQLALKSVGGTAKVQVYDAGATSVDNILPSPEGSDVTDISTATDLYYDITSLNGKTVVLSNPLEGTAILSITNVKITYTAEHVDSLAQSYFSVAGAKINKVLDSLNKTEDDGYTSDAGDGISMRSASLSLEDEILVNFYFQLDETRYNDSNLTEMGLLTWSSNPGTVSYTSAEKVILGALYDEDYVYTNGEKGRYMVQTDGIAAKNMGDDLYVCVYLRKNDGSYVYGNVLSYNPKTYAYNRINNSTDEKMKALCVALLNYGAAAQNYFGYNTDSLMNADLTDAQKDVATAYNAITISGAAALTNSKHGVFTNSDAATVTATVSFEGALAINYYYTPANTPNGNVALYYWSAEDYGNATTLTVDNASGIIPMTDCGDGKYWAQIDGIAAQDFDEIFYTAVVYTSGETTYYSTVSAYSINQYCLNMINKDDTSDDMKALAKAAAVYGYYAAQYFTPAEG